MRRIGSYKRQGKYTGNNILERYQKDQILKLLKTHDEDSICKHLNISPETFRKHVYFLKQEGRLE